MSFPRLFFSDVHNSYLIIDTLIKLLPELRKMGYTKVGIECQPQSAVTLDIDQLIAHRTNDIKLFNEKIVMIDQFLSQTDNEDADDQTKIDIEKMQSIREYLSYACESTAKSIELFNQYKIHGFTAFAIDDAAAVEGLVDEINQLISDNNLSEIEVESQKTFLESKFEEKRNDTMTKTILEEAGNCIYLVGRAHLAPIQKRLLSEIPDNSVKDFLFLYINDENENTIETNSPFSSYQFNLSESTVNNIALRISSIIKNIISSKHLVLFNQESQFNNTSLGIDNIPKP